MSRWIDADALTKCVEDSNKSAGLHIEDLRKIRKWIKKAPSIDIVRCKECKYYDKFPTWSACTYWSGDPYEQASVNDDDFCSYGERRE